MNNNSNNLELNVSEKIVNYPTIDLKFTPITQLAYLYFLYNEHANLTNNQFAKLFNTSLMNASRALKGLYDYNLLTYEVGGKTLRSKIYKINSRNLYFSKGKNHLFNPIKKIVYTKDIPDNSFIAGEEALSLLTMMNPTNQKIRAISSKNFNNQNIRVINNEDIIKDNNLVKLEIWKYDPKFFAKNNTIDNLSLYLTLKDSKNERIENELEQLLRSESWYMV